MLMVLSWFFEGYELYRRHPITFSLATLVGMFFCFLPLYLFDTFEGLLYLGFGVENIVSRFFNGLGGTFWASLFDAFPEEFHRTLRGFRNMTFLVNPVLVFTFPPAYAGLHYLALRSIHGDKPRIRDVFKGLRRYSASLVLWWLIYLVPLIVLCITRLVFSVAPLPSLIGLVVAPLLSAVGLVAFPILIDKQQNVAAAYGAALKTVFTFRWENWTGSLNTWGGFWLYGWFVLLVGHIGIWIVIGIFFTLPLAVCAQVFAYKEIFTPDSEFQQEMRAPEQPQPKHSATSKAKVKAKDTRLLSQIRELRDQISEQIHSANDSVKSLLENSTEAVDNVFERAERLSQRLQEIDAYFQTSNMQTLHDEKTDIVRKQAAAPNTAVSAQYEEALRTLEERIENHRSLGALREQINAQLVTIRVSLGNMQAKIIRIKTTEISQARLESDGVSETLQDLQIETDALLESLDERAETT